MNATKTLAEQIEIILNGEVKRRLAESQAKIAELEAKLRDSESRWERLRDLLGNAPPVPVVMPQPVATPARNTDEIVAAFHERRRTSHVPIGELARALGLCESNAYTKYNRWCKRTGNERIKHTGGHHAA